MKGPLAAILLLCLAILSAAQMLVLGAVPHSPNEDLSRHIALALNFRDALASGQWIPRIQVLPSGAPDRILDIPTFQYYGFLSSMLAQPGLALGLSPLQSLVTGVIVARWLAALAMLANCRLLGLGRPAGIIAAAAWLAFPYIQTNLYGRVAIPETIAQAVIPMLPLAWLLMAKGCRVATITTAASVVLLALSHPIFLLWGAGLHLSYAALLFLRRERSDALQLFLGLVAGMGLAAFQWLPAALTMGGLASHFLEISPYDRAFLSSTSGITGLPIAVVDGDARYYFTVAVWTLPGGVAAFFLAQRDLPVRAMVTAFTGILAVFLLLAYSPFDVWRAMPRAIWATQFPYRLFSFVAVFGALTIAYTCNRLLRRSLLVSALTLIMVVMVSGPALLMPAFPPMALGDPRVVFCSQDYIMNDGSRVVAGDGWLLKDNRIQVPRSNEQLYLMVTNATSGLPGRASVMVEVVDTESGRVLGEATVPPVPTQLRIPLVGGLSAVSLKPATYFRPSDVSASKDARELSISLDQIAIAPQESLLVNSAMVDRKQSGPYSRTFQVNPAALRRDGVVIAVLPMAFSRFWHLTQAGRELNAVPNYAGLTTIHLADPREEIHASYRLPNMVWFLEAGGLIICLIVTGVARRDTFGEVR